MDCISLRVEGAAGQAVRFAPAHRLVDVLDQWLITLHSPRLFGSHSDVRMGSQLVMLTIPLDVMAGGGYPRRMGTTHVISLVLLATEFRIGWLDDGAVPRMRTVVGAAEVALPSGSAARMAGQTMAAALAHGDVPLGCESSTLAFEVAAYTAARAAALVTPVRVAVS